MIKPAQIPNKSGVGLYSKDKEICGFSAPTEDRHDYLNQAQSENISPNLRNSAEIISSMSFVNKDCDQDSMYIGIPAFKK